MQLKEPYKKVLAALSSGEPKNGDELSTECGFLSRLDCTGAISLLRRLDAIEQAGHGKYRITDMGRIMLQGGARIELTPRETR